MPAIINLLERAIDAVADIAGHSGGVFGEFCAGAVLARLVGRVFFAEMAAILPSLRRAGDGPLEWAHSPTFRSLATLRVAV